MCAWIGARQCAFSLPETRSTWTQGREGKSSISLSFIFVWYIQMWLQLTYSCIHKICKDSTSTGTWTLYLVQTTAENFFLLSFFSCLVSFVLQINEEPSPLQLLNSETRQEGRKVVECISWNTIYNCLVHFNSSDFVGVFLPFVTAEFRFLINRLLRAVHSRSFLVYPET